LFGTIGVHKLAITCDLGAEVTLVPEEVVDTKQLTGETREIKGFSNSVYTGKVCNIVIDIQRRSFKREAATHPGDVLKWTACMSMPLENIEETDFLLEKIRENKHRPEEDTLYIPLERKNGVLHSGTLVSEGILVESEQPVIQPHIVPDIVKGSSEQGTNEIYSQQEQKNGEGTIENEVEREIDGSKDDEQILVVEENASADVEGQGVALGGSAEEQGVDNLSVEGMKSSIPRTDLAWATRADESLNTLYKLGELDKEGYHIDSGILFRNRLDLFEQTIQQICLPISYRQKCLTLAHNAFGHQ